MSFGVGSYVEYAPATDFAAKALLAPLDAQILWKVSN